MANVRIIFDNVVDRAASVTANTTAGSLVASNMLNEYKGKAHRSTSTSVTYTITWTSDVQIGGVALPATNLSSDATIKVRLFNAVDVPIADSGPILACPGNTLELWNWSLPLNANSFIYGGASKTAVWFEPQIGSVRKVVIDLVDTNNAAGYIDCARIVAGTYWEPTYNVSNGLSVTINDLSQTTRNDSGDLLADRSIIHDQLSFDFSVLLDTDKHVLMQILRKVGTSRNMLVSVFPDNNSLLEQSHMVYGKRTNSSIGTDLFGIYSHAMEMEGW